MQPQDSNLPPVNNWQPQGPAPYSYGDLPPVDPSRERHKKVLIFAGIILGAMLLLALIASIAGGGSKKAGSGEYINSTAQTTVELADYDKEAFSMRYPKSLSILTDEALDEQAGWYLSLQQTAESSDYEVSVLVGNAGPEYINGEEAVNELVDESALTNVQTSDVVMAGVQTKKTTAEYTVADQQFYIVYAHAQVGDQYIEYTAKYDKKRVEITDSVDAVLGSIKLK